MSLLLAIAIAVSMPPKCSLPLRADPADDSQAEVRRQKFPPQVIQYPYGTRPRTDWGFNIGFHVDKLGHITCYSAEDRFDINRMRRIEFHLNPYRRRAIAEMVAKGYEPFIKNGVPVAVDAAPSVREEELPESVAAPSSSGPRDSIRLGRKGCYRDSCATYWVTITRDGHVRFDGERGDIVGTHEYSIAPKGFDELVRSFAAKGLWGTRPEYHSPAWDQPTFTIEVEIGGRKHRIVDVAGADMGMPVVVTEFQDEVDRVGRTGMWTQLTLEGVARLREEGFDFRSPAGSKLLSRMFFNGIDNEDVPLRLLELGVPFDSVREFHGATTDGSVVRIPAIEDAVSAQLARVTADLLRRGALVQGGRVDPQFSRKLMGDAVFAGRIELVKAIWDTASPALNESQAASLLDPLLLLRLDHEPLGRKKAWQGLEIIQWFEQRGADLKVRDPDSGRNLMQIATQAEDAKLVKYLVDRGLDPSAEGEYHTVPIDQATDEDVMLVLLAAGADISKSEYAPGQLRQTAMNGGWDRVVAWLDAHHAR